MSDSPANILFNISGSDIGSATGSLGTHLATTGSVHLTNSVLSITGSVFVDNQVTVTSTGSLPVQIMDNDFVPVELIHEHYNNVNRIPVNTRLASGPQLDSFARLRVSTPTTIFDSKLVYDASDLYFNEKLVTGGTVTYDAAKSAVNLAVTGTSGSRAIRQTKRYFNYQPGKSHLILATFAADDTNANTKKKVGYFDDNNGIFFQINGSILQFVIRTDYGGGSPVENVVDQSSWNVDPLDSTGHSSITFDPTKAQILIIDFEWLGVGIVRVGFVIGGEIHIVHEFKHANIISNVYMRTPNLPVRWEVESSATSSGASFNEICCSVSSEAGYDPIGTTRTVDRGITTESVDDDEEPLISIRLKSTHIRKTIFPKTVNVVTTSNANFRWQLALNPTITGGSAANWTSVPNSAVEYDVTRSGVISDPGVVLIAGYATDSTNLANVVLDSLLALSADIDGTVLDELVLSVRTFSFVNENFLGAITWFEVV